MPSEYKVYPSVALSDAFLAGISFLVALKMIRSGSYPSGLPFGLLVTAAAATVGVWRFGFNPGVIPAHRTLFCLAIGLGVPFIMLTLGSISSSSSRWKQLLESLLSTELGVLTAIAAACIILAARTDLAVTETVCQVVLTLCVVVALGTSAWYKHAISGCVVLLYVATAAFGGDGDTLMVKNVNWLHYILGVANIVLLYV